MPLGQFFCEACPSLQENLFIDLRRLYVVGLKSAACSYCDSSSSYVCARMLFVTVSDCCVSRVTYHITFFLFLVPLIIYCRFFCTDISCLSSVMVHPSSHTTHNDISGNVFIYGKCGSVSLACLYLVAGILLCVRT